MVELCNLCWLSSKEKNDIKPEIIIIFGFIKEKRTSMLKKSFYNIEVDKLPNGNLLLFNSLSGSFGIMDNETQNIYSNLFINEEEISDKKVKSNIEILKNNGFLVENNLNEYDKIKVLGDIQRYSNNSLGLTIALTMNCNMACPYCYESKSDKHMSDEIINDLIIFVENRIKNGQNKSLSISWYGGEPLLELNTIRKLSKSFIELCEKYSVNYSAGIITNGSLLDYETAIILKNECKVGSAQITLDGIGETNNKRRCLKNGKDSFSIITSNIEACKDIISISLRVNVDKSNLNETEKMIDYIIDERKWMNKINYYFSPVTTPTDACNINHNDCFSNSEFGQIDTNLLNYMNKKKDFKNIDRLFPRPRVIPCMAVTMSSYVVDPDGDLYPCWNIVGIKDKKIGNIKTGINYNAEYFKWLSLDISEKCKSCKMLPLCQGGCPYNRINGIAEFSCNFKIYSFKEYLKIIYKNYYNNKNKPLEA